MAYFEAVIEVLTEMAVLEAEKEAVETVIETINTMPRTRAIRKTVATMANGLKRVGFFPSDAFRFAWRFVKVLTATHEAAKEVEAPLKLVA